MNRNMLLAFVLAVGFYTVWLKWIERKYPRAKTDKAVAAQLAAAPAAKAAAPETTPAAPQAKAPVQAAQKTEFKPLSQPEIEALAAQLPSTPEGAITFTSGKATMLFNPDGAGITSFQYQGPVATAELIPQGHPGFFSTLPGLRFSLKERSGNRIAFSAELAKGVTLEKSFNWDPDGVGTLEITARNASKTPFSIP